MSQTLYRKYRPQNFSEVIGQAHIVRTLKNAIKNDHISQAYLFTGPRGTGKTSIARILAKTVNCLDLKDGISCGQCSACHLIDEGKTLDIIEIDAASNTGVDNIRELRQTVALPPTALKFKVYIIDEVHMLSTGAFNALLKTLEEPPAHVIFILATTEIHKVPQTILSRCQRFDFSRLPLENIIEKLTLIAQAEKVEIEKEALEMIAMTAEGGMRDAESLLGQIIALEDRSITVKEVEEILGATDRKMAATLADLLISQDSSGAIEKINALSEDGYDLQVFTKTFINYLRQLMLLSISPELKNNFTYEMTSEEIKAMLEQSQKIEMQKILQIIDLFWEAGTKISSAILPQLPLEMAIIRATGKLPNNIQRTMNNEQELETKEPEIKEQSATKKPIPQGPSPKSLDTPKSNVEIDPTEATEIKTNLTPPASSENESAAEASPEEDANIFPGDETGEIDADEARSGFKRLLTEIRPYNHSLCALLSTCEVRSVSGHQITFATPYDFYQEKLNDPPNRLTIEDVFSKILGLKVRITTITDRSIMPQSNASGDGCQDEQKEGHQDSLLSSAMEIMGGKVVEE